MSGYTVTAGDILYFVIYQNTNGPKGSIFIQNIAHYANDDVSGSAYVKYTSGDSIPVANFDEISSYAEARKYYSVSGDLTDEWDVDTFYINNTSSDSNSEYVVYFTNGGNTTANGGQYMTLVLYTVDTSSSYFTLTRKASTSAKVNVEKAVSFNPSNSKTKYFLEVMSSDNDDTKVCQYDSYTFYTIFYPET